MLEEKFTPPPGAFTRSVPIRFSHCDAAGIVYFPHYFDMFNGLIEDWYKDELDHDANGVPHFVQGICGNTFQTPFASPPGVGESSAVVNVIWGWLNFVFAAALLWVAFPPLPPPIGGCAAGALGALGIALLTSRHFGKVRHAPPAP